MLLEFGAVRTLPDQDRGGRLAEREQRLRGQVVDNDSTGNRHRQWAGLEPAYTDADPAGQATLAATFDTFAATALVTNSAGNFLGWGVAVPMFAVAILRTRVLPRWIGWLGLLVGVLAGWLGLLSPASDVIEGISSIGFLGFFVFMLSMGIAILRRHDTRQSVDNQ